MLVRHSPTCAEMSFSARFNLAFSLRPQTAKIGPTVKRRLQRVCCDTAAPLRDKTVMEEQERKDGCVLVLNPHLQCGQHYLFHGREVGLPEELSLLSEGQDLILVDGADGGRDLQTDKRLSVLIWDGKIETGPRGALWEIPIDRKSLWTELWAGADTAGVQSCPPG